MLDISKTKAVTATELDSILENAVLNSGTLEALYEKDESFPECVVPVMVVEHDNGQLTYRVNLPDAKNHNAMIKTNNEHYTNLNGIVSPNQTGVAVLYVRKPIANISEDVLEEYNSIGNEQAVKNYRTALKKGAHDLYARELQLTEV